MYAIVSDFDGTITTRDVGDFLLLHFRLVTPEEIETGYGLNAPVGKWMKKFFRRIEKIPVREIEKAIYKRIKVKKGVRETMKICKNKGIPFEIASGGVDLYARPVFKKEQLKARSFFGKCRLVRGKAKIEYPFLKNMELSDFKRSRVDHYRKKGYTVIFCGDAPNDLKAALAADRVFADSRLYKICRERKIKCRKLSTFLPVLKIIS